MMLTPKIIGVCAMPDFMLRVNFENGIDRIFDVKPYIRGTWFGELGNEIYFKQVKVVDGGIEWPNGQDIAPHELYEI